MPQAHELIVQFLEEAGIDAVFGIPGGGTGQIFTNLVGEGAGHQHVSDPARADGGDHGRRLRAGDGEAGR